MEELPRSTRATQSTLYTTMARQRNDTQVEVHGRVANRYGGGDLCESP